MAKEHYDYFSNISPQTFLKDTFNLMKSIILFCFLYVPDNQTV